MPSQPTQGQLYLHFSPLTNINENQNTDFCLSTFVSCLLATPEGKFSNCTGEGMSYKMFYSQNHEFLVCSYLCQSVRKFNLWNCSTNFNNIWYFWSTIQTVVQLNHCAHNSSIYGPYQFNIFTLDQAQIELNNILCK